MKSVLTIVIALGAVTLGTAVFGQAQNTLPQNADWTKPFPPFRMVGNIEWGGKADFRFGETPGARFEPAKVDRTLKDGDTISLGGTVLTAHHHPGHTKGATSFTLNVQDAGKTYRVIIANMGTINPGVKVS